MLMQNSNVLKVILFIAGILLLIAGGFALSNPVGFTARNGSDIADQVSVLNDYRAAGGLMLGSAVVILLGIIHSRMAFTSTIVAIMAHFSIALGRIISIGGDGMPAKGLVAATIVEVIAGLLAVLALVKYREQAAKT